MPKRRIQREDEFRLRRLLRRLPGDEVEVEWVGGLRTVEPVGNLQGVSKELWDQMDEGLHCFFISVLALRIALDVESDATNLSQITQVTQKAPGYNPGDVTLPLTGVGLFWEKLSSPLFFQGASVKEPLHRMQGKFGANVPEFGMCLQRCPANRWNARCFCCLELLLLLQSMLGISVFLKK